MVTLCQNSRLPSIQSKPRLLEKEAEFIAREPPRSVAEGPYDVLQFLVVNPNVFIQLIVGLLDI
jgi:hypothetical protein